MFETLAAFKLDLGNQTTNSRVQLAIPVQPGSNAQAGDEVYFFRKGQVPQPDGTMADTWWLVENGFVGEDGIARTARPMQAWKWTATTP